MLNPLMTNATYVAKYADCLISSQRTKLDKSKKQYFNANSLLSINNYNLI